MVYTAYHVKNVKCSNNLQAPISDFQQLTILVQRVAQMPVSFGSYIGFRCVGLHNCRRDNANYAEIAKWI